MSPAALLRYLLLTVAVAGCGAGGVTSSGARTASVATHKQVFVRPADALVTMRSYSPRSLMWQTIFVRRDGSGVLTSLIGEVSGAPQKAFRLSNTEFARLRRLLNGAKAVRAGPEGTGDYIYTLHIAGEPSISLEGPIPRRLVPLVSFLNGLMLGES